MQPVVLEHWRQWQREGFTRLPCVEIKRAVRRPNTWGRFTANPVSVLLESGQAGRYSYLCDEPARVVLGGADGAEIWTPDGAAIVERRAGRPLAVLESILRETRAPRLSGWPAMTGGLMGVFGYDLVHTWERLPMSARRDLPLPLYAMIETRELFIYDYHEEMLGIVVWCDGSPDLAALAGLFAEGEAKVRRAWSLWENANAVPSATPHPPLIQSPPNSAAPAPSFTPDGFRAAVVRAKEYIAAGDTYQVNLSLRTSRAVKVSPEVIYEALRGVNPSPYMGLLRFPEFALVCGSPELLVKLENGLVSSRPIAGTRPRGHAAVQDARYSTELLASEKERAEHLMLVDLIRNDIGRIAKFGSVHVSEFMALEHYSHVMHIVSQVEGQLASGQTWTDVLRSMFPGGTITGCPKIRTMEIIEELEPVGRGFYTGALGWINFAGDMEMNIVIRSMLVQNGVAHVQAGAGIVADSQPEHELDEALRKARALWVALDEADKSHG